MTSAVYRGRTASNQTNCLCLAWKNDVLARRFVLLYFHLIFILQCYDYLFKNNEFVRHKAFLFAQYRLKSEHLKF